MLPFLINPESRTVMTPKCYLAFLTLIIGDVAAMLPCLTNPENRTVIDSHTRSVLQGKHDSGIQTLLARHVSLRICITALSRRHNGGQLVFQYRLCDVQLSLFVKVYTPHKVHVKVVALFNSKDVSCTGLGRQQAGYRLDLCRYADVTGNKTLNQYGMCAWIDKRRPLLFN